MFNHQNLQNIMPIRCNIGAINASIMKHKTRVCCNITKTDQLKECLLLMSFRNLLKKCCMRQFVALKHLQFFITLNEHINIVLLNAAIDHLFDLKNISYCSNLLFFYCTHLIHSQMPP